MRRRYASLLALAMFAGASCNLVVGAGDYKVGHTGPGGASSASTSTSGSNATTTATGSNATTSTSTSMQGLAVAPMTTTVLANAAIAFTATLNGSPASNVTWSVDESGGGAVDSNGVYTAPASAGTFHVRATNGSGSFAATVTIGTSVMAVKLTSSADASTTAQTGFGIESHLAYATGPGEWWLFALDPTAPKDLVLTRHSKDFVNWSSGPNLTLSQGHSGDGRDLNVVSRPMNGHDVAHLTIGSSNLGRYHARAVMTDGAISFDPAAIVNTGGDGTLPDASATAILDDGTVIDSTGWESTPQTPPLSPCGNGDVDMFTANAKEDGMTSFAGVGFGQQVIWCVGSHVNARKLIPLGQTLVTMYEDGESDPTPVNILTSIRQMDGTWLPLENPAGSKVKPPTAFATDQTFGLNDWNAAAIGTTVHAVRRLGGFFEHTSLPSGGSWTLGQAIPAAGTDADSGLFLAPYGAGLVLVAISGSPGSPIVYSAFNGTSWSTWATLVPAGSQRTWISGYAAPGAARPAVIWMESGYINGVLLP
jgi:hypothetical protein